MKKLYLLVLLLFCCKLNAQNYVPFATDSAAWSVDFITPGPWWQEYHVPRTYFMNGDSVVNGINYNKIFQAGDSIPFLTGGLLTALIREQNKQVYCRYYNLNNFSIEYLLYDFNLNVGDTFSFPNYMDSTTIIVTSIDSELTTTGYRRAYNFYIYHLQGAYMLTPRWVEGIGDIVNGVIYPEVPWVDWWCQSLCYSEKYAPIWNWSQGNCWITGINDPENKNPGFSIMKNPVDDISEIEIFSLLKSFYSITDLSGKIVSSGTLSSGKNLIPVNHLSKGLYILKCNSVNDNHILKLIKN